MTAAVSTKSDKSNSTKRTQSVARKLSLHRVLYSFIRPAQAVVFTDPTQGVVFSDPTRGAVFSDPAQGVVKYSLILHRVLYSSILVGGGSGWGVFSQLNIKS